MVLATRFGQCYYGICKVSAVKPHRAHHHAQASPFPRVAATATRGVHGQMLVAGLALTACQ